MSTALKKNSWIKTDDFIETTLWISITNTATHSKPIILDPAEVSEFWENGFSFKIPKNTGVVGTFLDIRIKRKRDGAPISGEIRLSAKITELESYNDTESLASIQFFQFPKEEWKLFLKEFATRQEKATQLIKNIKE